MRESLKFLCNGRHVFLGKKIFMLRGACYASCIHTGMQPWQFVYIGENEMKVNISLKVKDREELIFHTLVSAGENWYEAKNQCEILLAGTNTVDFWLQLPDSREAKIESLELTDIPKRPERMTRLSVMTEALSDSAVKRLPYGTLDLERFIKVLKKCGNIKWNCRRRPHGRIDFMQSERNRCAILFRTEYDKYLFPGGIELVYFKPHGIS